MVGGLAQRVDVVSGVPEELSTRRRAYIYQPARSAMQSGLLHANNSWRIDFDNSQQRWENPLTGWTASRDPVQAISLNFRTLDEAIRFASKQGWQYTVRESNAPSWKKKSYAENFLYSPKPLRFIRTK